MSNTTLLYGGYIFVALLYGAYWVALKLRLAKVEKKRK